MLKAFMIVLISLSAGLCKAQLSAIDTLRISEVITSIDSAEQENITLSRYIVRKYMHNETKVDYEFLLDTSTRSFYKCIYISRTLQSSNDTTIEKLSFYVYRNQFVALKCQQLQNSKEISSEILYLESDTGQVQRTYPSKSSLKKPLTSNEIKYKATELWLGAEALKEMISRRKGG